MDIVVEDNIIFADEKDQKKFEEALIRIEDQEDAEAFKLAKQEIDEEFNEDGGGGAPSTIQSNAGPSTAPSGDKKEEQLEFRKGQLFKWKGSSLNKITK